MKTTTKNTNQKLKQTDEKDNDLIDFNSVEDLENEIVDLDENISVEISEETLSEETLSEETLSEETLSEETPSEETPSEETPSEETPSEETQTENSSAPKELLTKGIVTNCSALRVRSTPNIKSQEIGRLNKDDLVRISMKNSTDKFYYIITKNLEGFCMKTYITIV